MSWSPSGILAVMQSAASTSTALARTLIAPKLGAWSVIASILSSRPGLRLWLAFAWLAFTLVFVLRPRWLTLRWGVSWWCLLADERHLRS